MDRRSRTRSAGVPATPASPHGSSRLASMSPAFARIPSQDGGRSIGSGGVRPIGSLAGGGPVVASDSGERPWVVGDAGVVVAEGDVAAWTAAIDRLLGDEAARRAQAAKGIERAHARFAWPVVARAHLSFFESL